MRRDARKGDGGAADGAATAGPNGQAIAGTGRILMWQGGSLWLGRDVSLSRAHAHHAIQISLGLGDANAALALRDGAAGPWRDYRAALVPPHRSHAFDGRGCSLAQLFIEPETAAGRALVAQYGGAGIAPLAGIAPDALSPFAQALQARRYDDGALIRAAHELIDRLVGPLPPRPDARRRLDGMLERIAASLPQGLTLEELAEQVHLSPGRTRHLFVAETGITFRGYILWLRINRAVELMMQGHSWTHAAHEAGFADSAHLSRTFRRVFGLSPAMIRRD